MTCVGLFSGDNRLCFRSFDPTAASPQGSSMGLLLLIVLILLLVGALPRWGYSQNWGNGPSGLVTILLVVVVVLFFTGHIRFNSF